MKELKEAIRWKPFPIKDFEDRYEISNIGVVRNITTKNIIKRGIRSDYISVTLCKDKKNKSFKVHRMVALAFIKNEDPEKIWVNHINGDKFDCSVVNLEWVTPTENAKHAVNTGLINQTKRKSDVQHNIDYSKYKQIVGFPNYIINNKGKIYSLKRNIFMLTSNHQNNGLMIQLFKEGEQYDFMVHRLVGMYFIKKTNPKHNSLRHKDKNKENNDVNNLEWCYVAGVEMPETHYDAPYYDPSTAIEMSKRKSISSGPKDLLTAKRKNLSKKQRIEQDLLKAKLKQKQYGGSKTTKTHLGSKKTKSVAGSNSANSTSGSKILSTGKSTKPLIRRKNTVQIFDV